MGTIQKKPEVKNTVVGSKNKQTTVKGLTRLDNSSENLQTRRYIWRTDPESSKEKQENGKCEKRKSLKDM